RRSSRSWRPGPAARSCRTSERDILWPRIGDTPMNSRFSSILRTCLALVLLILIAGCGGAASVSGTVTHKPTGKKVASGTVMFLGSDGTPVYAPISPEGKYTASLPTAGTVKIAVNSPKPGADASKGGAGGRGGGRGGSGKTGPGA